MRRPHFRFEDAFEGDGPIAGIDEAGRGPLAGPVVAAAAVIDRTRPIPRGINDSKQVKIEERERLFGIISERAVIGVGIASVEEIETLNIRRANHLAMQRAVAMLPQRPVFALIDGNDPPELPCATRAIIDGDTLSLSIAAASIIAKVTRDRIMIALHEEFPVYGWRTNMGYGTQEHFAGLNAHGVSPHHRKTFAPIHNILCAVNPGDSILTL